MPAWLIPAIKAVLPHVGTIVSAASPVFTRKSTVAERDVLQQQITELQAAASANDAHIKELAVQVKNTVELLEMAERSRQRLRGLCVGAGAIAVLSLCTAMFAVFAR